MSVSHVCVCVSVYAGLCICERGSKRLMLEIFYSLPFYFILLNITKYNKTKLSHWSWKRQTNRSKQAPEGARIRDLLVFALRNLAGFQEAKVRVIVLRWPSSLFLLFFMWGDWNFTWSPHSCVPQHTRRRKEDHAFNLQVLMVGPSPRGLGCSKDVWTSS